jgi:hypothetical protein
VPTDPYELVRKWFHAFTAGDLETLTSLYHADATNDSGASIANGRGCVIGVTEGIGRCLVDRRRARTGGRIGLCARVHGQR